MSQVMRCEKCGGVIEKGKETIMNDAERRILPTGRPGEFRVTLLKHANEADCQPTRSPAN